MPCCPCCTPADDAPASVRLPLLRGNAAAVCSTPLHAGGTARLRLCVAEPLFQLDLRPCLLEFGFQLVGLLFFDALLDGLRSLVDERLRLFEAEAGRRADDLDDLDLLVAGLGEDHVDGPALFLLGAGVAATGACG